MITVTYNSADQLRQCWTDVLPRELLWIVVDNASQDDSAAVAEGMGAQVIQMPKNVGFSAGCNVGMRACDRELLLFANPDLRIVVDDFPELEADVRHGGGLSAPRLRDLDGARQPNARGMPYLVDKLASRGVKLPWADLDGYLWPEPSRVAWLMGAAVATTRAALTLVGGWPERYFVYFEDHDLGLAYRSRGLPVRCLDSMQWVHTWTRDPVKGTAAKKYRAGRLELASAIRFYLSHLSLILGRERPVRLER